MFTHMRGLMMPGRRGLAHTDAAVAERDGRRAGAREPATVVVLWVAGAAAQRGRTCCRDKF
jgi:hypothetical protein